MIRYAKSTGAAIVLVGHVTKEGQIAGPRVVEHMVDAVLYFEGEGGHHFRILRTVKNRFGPTDEIGVFEMSDKGLREVANPSELFLGERQRQGAGRGGLRRHGGHAAGAGRDPGAGRALDARHAAPRRRRLGPARLSMVLAVLEAHCGVRFATARRLSQRRRRLPHHRAGRRSRGRGRTGFVAHRSCPSRRLRLFRRNQPFGRGPAGCACAAAAQGSGKAGVWTGRAAVAAARNCRAG